MLRQSRLRFAGADDAAWSAAVPAQRGAGETQGLGQMAPDATLSHLTEISCTDHPPGPSSRIPTPGGAPAVEASWLVAPWSRLDCLAVPDFADAALPEAEEVVAAHPAAGRS